MPYTPVNWQDYPSLATAINAANLNHMEAGILAAYVAGTGGLTNADIAAGAGISYSKLNLAASIVDGDISPAAAIAIAKLAGYPSDVTKFLSGAGTWITPPTVTPNFVLISDIPALGSSTTTVSFTSIPQTYRHLYLRIKGRTTQTTGASGATAMMRVNGDTTAANYGSLAAVGAGNLTAGTTLGASIGLGLTDTRSLANSFSIYETVLPWYTDAALVKLAMTPALVSGKVQGASFTNQLTYATLWQWSGIAAVTQIELSPDATQWAAGCRFDLYGIS